MLTDLWPIAGGCLMHQTAKEQKNNFLFRRLYYVHYIDNFVFDYVGIKKEANMIYKIIQKYLKEKLFFNCNEAKTRIVYGSVHITYFGALIR